jgi:hypothetical protein
MGAWPIVVVALIISLAVYGIVHELRPLAALR